MILQALSKYYERLNEEGRVAPQGFKRVEIRFIIVLDQHGEFMGLQDTRTLSGNKMVARSAIPAAE